MTAERISVDHSDSERVEDIVLRAVAHELRIPLNDLTAEALAGDVSSRQYVRVSHPERSIVGVRYPRPFSLGDASTQRLERWCHEFPDDGVLTFANDPVCQIEMTALLARAEVPVPEILAVDDREGVILLEDVGDSLLQSWMASADSGAVIAAFERAVDLIGCVRSATEAAIDAGSAGSRLALDGDKLCWELEFFLVNTFERALRAPLEPELVSQFRREARSLSAALAERPRFLCHRDFHARNLIVRPGSDPVEGLVVIDFQDARMGPLTYDLVSLVEDPYVQLENWLRQRLVARFRELAYVDGTWPGDVEFGEEYDLTTVQRMLKAVGTFANQAAVRGKRDYLPYIAPALSSAGAALERLGRFAALTEVVSRLRVTQIETE